MQSRRVNALQPNLSGIRHGPNVVEDGCWVAGGAVVLLEEEANCPWQVSHMQLSTGIPGTLTVLQPGRHTSPAGVIPTTSSRQNSLFKRPYSLHLLLTTAGRSQREHWHPSGAGYTCAATHPSRHSSGLSRLNSIGWHHKPLSKPNELQEKSSSVVGPTGEVMPILVLILVLVEGVLELELSSAV